MRQETSIIGDFLIRNLDLCLSDKRSIPDITITSQDTTNPSTKSRLNLTRHSNPVNQKPPQPHKKSGRLPAAAHRSTYPLFLTIPAIAVTHPKNTPATGHMIQLRSHLPVMKLYAK